MKIRLKHKSLVLTQGMRVAVNHRTKKSVDLVLGGEPGAYELATEDIDIAADCLVNRGWSLVEPAVLSLPVIRNAEGLIHPEEFVFTAKSGRLSREQVREAAAKLNKKSSTAKEKEAAEVHAPNPPSTPEGADDSAPAGGEGAVA